MLYHFISGSSDRKGHQITKYIAQNDIAPIILQWCDNNFILISLVLKVNIVVLVRGISAFGENSAVYTRDSF